MNQEIGRLGFVFKYRIRLRSYHDKRCFLRAKPWAMAEAAIQARFYCEFLTFPGWKPPEGMRDFERVWGRFPLTDHSALCVQINASPIADGIGDSVFQLLPEPLWQELRADLIGVELLDDLPVSDWPRSLRSALETPLARLLEGRAPGQVPLSSLCPRRLDPRAAPAARALVAARSRRGSARSTLALPPWTSTPRSSRSCGSSSPRTTTSGPPSSCSAS